MTRLRLLTLNFFLRPPGVSEKGSKGDWKFERLRLFAETQFQNYDIIALQETFASLSSRRNELISLAQKHGLKYVAAGKKQSIWKLRVDAGLIILSRIPIVSVDEWTFVRGTEIGDWLAAKGVLYAKIQAAPDRHLHLFATHFQSTDSPRAIELRHRQYIEAKRFIDNMLEKNQRKPSEPVLFVGDMNVDARAGPEDGIGHGAEYLKMLGIYSGATADPDSTSGAKCVRYDVGNVCYEILKEHPITTSRLRVGPGRPEPDRKCIDFVLTFRPAGEDGTLLTDSQKDINFENVRVEKFEVKDQPFSFLSDHFGVAVDLVIEDGATNEQIPQ
ncbi:uncharacterized protein SPPG_01629 [Spizellomyces punctatus DAOM BR117]|uniref:sphingomyelin phosphodiesterase n=1 Tax=Spizellomyces punctatus (strain DAOM BR117) TaxID=645134 RepID=A0A0L0HS63_SPIPD|nr:uncharacterized protein SPPG_01629 [Spizellomyces punctatus DAOM BR117]KND04196.1 hypothetical protein SPPG_01629 [Spizellomyces punctatus DAOM BR117]|eukprot:XP_016612235.1 hypothetical protein SPPG_01629 [Spizellomyces punctatus DAOM BR117]